MSTKKTIEVKLTNENEDYTIPEIIEQVREIFGFDFSTHTHGGKLYDAIKHQIWRNLDGKQVIGGGKRNRKYSRKDVYKLLSEDLYDYFLKKSKEKNAEDCKKTVTSERKKNYQQSIEKAENSLQAKGEIIAKYIEDFAKNLEDLHKYMQRYEYGTETEDDIEFDLNCEIVERKKKIFFQFFFESLFDIFFDFNADGFKADLLNLPDNDDPRPDGASIMANARYNDIHSYTTPKISPEDFRHSVAKMIAEWVRSNTDNQ